MLSLAQLTDTELNAVILARLAAVRADISNADLLFSSDLALEEMSARLEREFPRVRK